MKQQIWNLLHLLLSLGVGVAWMQGCEDVNRTVTVQLRRTHILRTWQPDGAQCRWWENRQSETNQFPAAVRSGPQWLVMQLKQPMMLDEVNVRGWDGRRQAAASVGSPVSAFGASSLPLELQLEDPCNASWETFGSSGRWRQLGEQGSFVQTPESFVLLKNSTGNLQWLALNLKGRSSCLKQLRLNSARCIDLDEIEKFGTRETVCFSVLDCSLKAKQSNVTCSIKDSDGKVSDVKLLRTNRTTCRHEFEFTSSLEHQGALLSCSQDTRQAERLERMLFVRIPPRTSIISPPAVWVSGRTASVSFITTESSPEPRHLCWIGQNGSKASSPQTQVLSELVVKRWVVRTSHNRPVFSVDFTFNFTVSEWMKSKSIHCTQIFGSNKRNGDVSSHVKHHYIQDISKPCETLIDLGKDEFWREGDVKSVWVRSTRCTHWNVTHSCLLLDSSTNVSEMLRKTKNTSFSSEHRLRVRRWMARRHWLVRCRVNQSGVEYPDVETSAAQIPAVFYKARLRIFSAKVDRTRMSVYVKSIDASPNVSDINCTAGFSGNENLKKMKQIRVSTQLWEFKIPELPDLHNNLTVTVHCSARQVFKGAAVYNLSKSESLTVKIESETELDQELTTILNSSTSRDRTRVIIASFGVLTLLLTVFIMGAAGVRLRATATADADSCDGEFQLTHEAENDDESEQRGSCSTQISRVTQQTSRETHSKFVQVLEVDLLPDSDNTGSCEDSDDDSLMYTKAAGHYELDGCSFVQYNEYRRRGNSMQ